MLKNIGAVLIGVLLLPLSPSQAPDDTAARTKDIYEIYSQLIPAAMTLTANPVYLIQSTTVVVPLDAVPGWGIDRCVKVPPNYAPAWAELLEEARSGKIVPGTLQPEFKLSKAYLLLRPAEIPAMPSSDPKFQGATDVFRLSVVYFNRNRTLALTSVGTTCGRLCGTGRWATFEKLPAGMWVERRDWVRCLTVA